MMEKRDRLYSAVIGLAMLCGAACSSKSAGPPDAAAPPDLSSDAASPDDAGAANDAAGDAGVQTSCGEIDGPTANNPGNPDDCTDDSPCPPGTLCGGFSCDTPWTCFSHDDGDDDGGEILQHPCPAETAPYCGCDGVTFYPQDTCPDRPFDHIGPCEDGVLCDPSALRCSLAEPSCPDGMLPSVVKGNYGPCVPVESCRCQYVFECPHRDKYSCDTVARRCVLNSSRDAGPDVATDGGDAAADAGRLSGVLPTKRLDQLTLDEEKTLCDFKASFYGGYGMAVDCKEGLFLRGDDSQDACLAAWPTTCPVTVSQYEQCSNDQTCDNSRPASCEALLPCQQGP